MTTYIIYADANDGYLGSASTSYTSAVSGTGLVMNNSLTYTRVGQNKSTTGTYTVYEGFHSFDTSVIADTEEIVDATINAHMGYGVNQKVWWDIEFRAHEWTAPLTTAQWKSVATIKTYPIRSSFDIMTPNSAYRTIATGGDTLMQNISKTAATKFISVSSRHVAGDVPTGVEEMWIHSGNATTTKPYLLVQTVAPNTLNSVSEASTTLPDGTTVSLRTDGTATNIVSVGYTPLNSSTWTSLGQINASFQTFTDGTNALAITSDPSGNFYIFGQRINTPGNLIGQAYKNLGSNTWQVMSPLEGPMPYGNRQTIRSIAAQYMPGGKDVNDKPSVHILLSRGASGVNLDYRYHTSGAGLVQNAQIKVDSLLAGTGTLINAAAGFNPSAAGIPAFVDMVPVGDHLNACYVQRAKIHGADVGGIAMVQVYNQSGKFMAWDKTYVATGASKLVPISDKMFAHVFDENALKLTVRFYNAQAQVIGSTSIGKEEFFGGVVGTQFAAYFDKTSNLLRVYTVSSIGSRTLDRWDVSPITFTATKTVSAIINLGATGSINSALRISRTSDERRVMIEAASDAAGVKSVAAAYSTVGNLAPNAPVLTAKSNFDATTAAVFRWTPGDPNPNDYSTAYQLEISRVSDSVVVHDTGKVVSTSTAHTVAANVLVNPTNYRWRVRTYDVMDAVGSWSNYGTFATSATGTLTITDPATDNVLGIETDDYIVTWNYVQSGGATQAQRRVRLIRTSDSAVMSDTTMQVNTSNTHTISGMESGKEYRIEVTVINSSSITTPVVSRLITPNYSEPMTPELLINYGESYIEVVVDNPTPTGDRPEVVWNDLYKRRTKSDSVESDFIRIAILNNSSTYKDFAVKSGTSYDYKVVGRTV